MTDNPKILVENDKCNSCDMHGNCPIEFVGGEDKLLTEKEMDEVLTLTELGMGNLMRHWDNHAQDRERLNDILKENNAPGFILASSKEGAEYFKFALRQAERMEFVSKKVLAIMLEATKRAEAAFAASKAQKN